MTKIILATIFSVFYLSSASAEVGANIGVSGQVGYFVASGNEKVSGVKSTADKEDGDAHGEAAWVSIFVEKDLGSRLAIGVDYVPHALESEATESAKTDRETAAVVENKIQIDFEDLTTVYLVGKVTDNLYLKAGYVQVDVITNENLGTGSTYGNTDIDGTMFGVGYNTSLDNGMFVRLEGNFHDFDGASVTSSASNVVSLDHLYGVSGKLSVGKSF